MHYVRIMSLSQACMHKVSLSSMLARTKRGREILHPVGNQAKCKLRFFSRVRKAYEKLGLERNRAIIYCDARLI
jgi:hypothetical protein